MRTAHTTLGNWLRKSPQPAYVVADGEKLAINTGAGDKWRQLVTSIEALDPEKLVAYAKDGTTLRAIALRSDMEPKASGAEPDSSDDTTRPLTAFARLIADAYDKGSKAPHPLERVLELSMQMTERQQKHITTLETENASLRRANARLIEELGAERAAHVEELAEVAAEAAAQSGGGPVEQAMNAFVGGMAQAQAQKALPPPSNGTREKGQHGSG